VSKDHREKGKLLFFEALKIAPEGRTSFLEKECGSDLELRREVDSLLMSHEEAGDFLENPAIAMSPDIELFRVVKDVKQVVPGKIGQYKIIKVLGEGGMGIVYLAEQKSPVSREVALKVIKRGMDSKEAVARFDLERQALAMMAHASISSVYDAGVTEQGQLYYVMEYVSGPSITDYCNKKHLTTKERLALFIQVCHAVQHAHQKGIIHRDLKPSNVLMAHEGAKAAPKIIDFGVAKDTDQELGSKTRYTMLGSIVGTPEYMSPEQADLGQLDIDTRTDIYTLGVLLYELLVGQTPFDFSNSSGKRYSDIQHRIQKEVPEKPSQRVCNLGDKPLCDRQNRGGGFKALRKQLQGDLDWIVMKAMEKDRMLRYASASELAADVARHMNNEPVQAGPPSAVYRFKKFVSKNRKTVTGVSALLCVLILGLSISLRLYFIAEKAESVAKQRLEDYYKLSDLYLVNSLTEDAEKLWPARIRKIPEIENWLEKAETLKSRLGNHRDKLNDMRRRSLFYNDDAKISDRATHPKAEYLEGLKKIKGRLENVIREKKPVADAMGGDIKTKEKIINAPLQLASINETIESVENEILNGRRTWIFEDTEEQLLHDRLTRLVDELEVFASSGGVMENVRKRIQTAREVERKTLVDFKDEWSKAVKSIGDIRTCPLYGGLVIKPQEGLIPFGRDPDSGLFEFAAPETGALPSRGQDKKIRMESDSCLILILVPGGSFKMGASNRQEDRLSNGNYDPWAFPREGPVHEVKIQPYFISKYEMTREQWRKISSQAYDPFCPIDDQTIDESINNEAVPVIYLSWLDCRKYLNRIGLDLPTEAQWEFAARAASSSIWCTGNDKLSVKGAANLRDIEAKKEGLPIGRIHEDWLNDGFSRIAPIGCFRPNSYGLHDVIGNVYEWCLDGYEVYEYPINEGDGKRILDQLDAESHVVRGGSWYTLAVFARSAFRVDIQPMRRTEELGVRPAGGLEN